MPLTVTLFFRPTFKPVQPYAPKDEIRPLFVNLTVHTARTGRSPLISLMFPTIKDKITDLSKSRATHAKKFSTSARPTFLDGSELERLVKLEMIKCESFMQ